MDGLTCKLLVIGAGPGGYVCAIRAGQLGLDTIIVDSQPPGGTCLNVGCIPSKAMIHAADEFHRLAGFAANGGHIGISASAPAIDLTKTIAWKDGIVTRLNNGVSALLKRARARLIAGQARFVDGKTVIVRTEGREIEIAAQNVVIATGSDPVELPFLPFGGDVISSAGALALDRVPDRLAVIGGGYIGLELGIALAKMGATVTVIEAAPRILPQYDADLTKPVAARLADLGIRVLTDTRAKGLGPKGGLLIDTGGGEQHIAADRILVTVGRRPRLGAGIEDLMLAMDGPFIRIDGRCRTSMAAVYAIGDVTGEPMLAHRAMAQGEMVAEIIAGEHREWDRRCIPAVCFTDPEIVSVGLSPSEARAAGHEIITGSFPFQANGRAMTMENEAGFVRIVARADNQLLLGVQAVGGGVSELSAAFALAIENGLRIGDVTGTIHAHPTQSEAFHEACLRALGHSLHI